MSPSLTETSPHSRRTSERPVPIRHSLPVPIPPDVPNHIRDDTTHTPPRPAPRPKMNIFTRCPTAPVVSPSPSTNATPKPLTSRTSWSILPLKAKAATFPSLLPRPSPNSSGNSSTTTLVNKEVEETKLSLAEEWAAAPQWRRDAAKKRVRAMRVWLGIIKEGEDGQGEEEEIEMDELDEEDEPKRTQGRAGLES